MSKNKSQIFTKYNELKKVYPETGRLNRALGVAQSKAERPYDTTPYSCTCPDHKFRGTTCKHMLAAKMEQEAEQKAEQEELSIEQINKDLFGF